MEVIGVIIGVLSLCKRLFRSLLIGLTVYRQHIF